MIYKEYRSDSIPSFNIVVRGKVKHILFTRLTHGDAYYKSTDAEEQKAIETHPWFGKRFLLWKAEEVSQAGPKTEQPAEVHDEPKTEQPAEVHDEPKTEQPAEVHDEPKTEQPAEVHDEPKTEQSAEVHDEPKTEQSAGAPTVMEFGSAAEAAKWARDKGATTRETKSKALIVEWAAKRNIKIEWS